MAMSNTERQARYRDKIKHGEIKRIEAKLPLEDARKLDHLIAHWKCSKTETIRRLILETWDREGNPVYDRTGKLLSDN
jgi:hypothetical protein